MSMSISSDDVSRAQAGDGAAFNRLLRAVSPHVERMQSRFPLSEEDRHDARQNALLRVFSALGSYREESRFSTWLYRVSANEALQVMRRVRSRGGRETPCDPSDLDVFEASDEAEGDRLEHAEVQRALDRLPDPHRSLLMAYYGEDRPLRDIAQANDESEAAVRARVHRARQLLREEMGVSLAG